MLIYNLIGRGKNIKKVCNKQSTTFCSKIPPHLLGFIEAVNFIDEQDGLPLAQSELVLRLLYHFPDLIGGCTGGGQSYKASRPLPLTGAGNDVG